MGQPITDESDESEERERVEARDVKRHQASASNLTLESNAQVEHWIKYFTETDRDRFQRFLTRGQTYRKVVEDVLLENELPPELYYLALIESGYKNHAISRAKAVGVWQFMPRTARHYGLVVTSEVDERRDPIRATEAAAKYLRDLYNIFGSWPLAMAAYNAGEYRIIRCIVKAKSRDFWTLIESKVLPRETAAYVPKMIAAATIGSDPERYGFNVESDESYPELEAVELPSPVKLTALAKYSKLSIKEIQYYNPHLRLSRTPAHLSKYEVWFTKDAAHVIRGNLSEIARARLATGKNARRLARNAVQAHFHKVKKGESLTLIARRHGTTVGFLKRVNGLSSGRIQVGTKLRVTMKEYRPKKQVRHRVRTGESLERIARRYGTTVQALKRQNSLESSRIFSGQVLTVQVKQI